jgi:hypothetical protein
MEQIDWRERVKEKRENAHMKHGDVHVIDISKADGGGRSKEHRKQEDLDGKSKSKKRVIQNIRGRLERTIQHTLIYTSKRSRYYGQFLRLQSSW